MMAVSYFFHNICNHQLPGNMFYTFEHFNGCLKKVGLTIEYPIENTIRMKHYTVYLHIFSNARQHYYDDTMDPISQNTVAPM